MQMKAMKHASPFNTGLAEPIRGHGDLGVQSVIQQLDQSAIMRFAADYPGMTGNVP